MIITASNPSRYDRILTSVRSALILAGRDLRSRYARSFLGPLWLILTPIALVAVYYVVFGLGLQVSWPHPAGGNIGFIVPFMAGLTIYQYFAELITSSLTLFYSKRNYVRKSTFSLFAIWLSNYFRVGFVAAVNLAILLGLLIWAGLLSAKGATYCLPVIAMILIIGAAVSLLLSILGPFIGDLSNGAAVFLRVMFYSAPITYPLEVLPEPWSNLVMFNPLTFMISLLRQTLIFGMPPDGMQSVALCAVAAVGLMISVVAYKRASGALPDVV